MDTETSQPLISFSIRIPEAVHEAALIKSIKTKKSVNKFINEKLAEWVNEPEAKTPTPRVTTARRAKVAAN